jgi:hypothetical protein
MILILAPIKWKSFYFSLKIKKIATKAEIRNWNKFSLKKLFS